MLSKFENRTASELIEGLRSGEWTSVELTQHFLGRIRQRNGDVHAVPFVFEKTALEQANESDQRRASGDTRGPLDGLPMTIKDSLRVKGLPSTYGLLPFRFYRPKTDSKIAKALRDEGIVFLGRTAVPTGAFDWNCRNQVYHECLNPFDPSRTPGGSSGGAAAALALGLTPLEIGSDLGGSIRYPAHCCGVYGLRTTDGLLPVDDIGPEGIATSFKSLVTLGPLANSLQDLKLLMGVFDRRLALQAAMLPSTKDKIAYTQKILGVNLEAESQALFDSYLESLRATGFEIEEVETPVDPDHLYDIWGIIAGYDYTSTIPKLLRFRWVKSILAWWLLDRRLGKGPFSDRFRAGLLATSDEYKNALLQREAVFAAVEKFFSKYSVWVTPVARGPAFPLDQSGQTITSEGRTFSYSEYVGSFTVPTVALGTPALSLPIGKTKGGLPVGVQIFGPRFSDLWLLDFAQKLLAGQQ